MKKEDVGTELDWLHLIDKSVSELRDFHAQSTHGNSNLHLYSEVLYAYLIGDVDQLSNLIAAFPKNEQMPFFLCALTKVRRGIRQHDVSHCDFQELEKAAAPNSILEGERHFVLGYALEIKQMHEPARDHYLRSHKFLSIHKDSKKSVKALLNAIAAESRINPERKLLADYELLFRKARRARELTVAGVCLVNISREFQKMGSLDVSLNYANRAVTYLARGQVESVDYYMALVNRCSIHFDKGHLREAELDYQRAVTAPFPEVHSALQILKVKMGKAQSSDIHPMHADPSWLERLRDLHRKGALSIIPPLSPMEEQLLSLLTIPRTKHEIVQKLYGDSVDFQFTENRFKVLFSRLRKKLPGVVALRDGNYEISDENFLVAFSDGIAK